MASAGRRVGIDVGGTKCLAVVVAARDDGWRVLSESRMPTPEGADLVAGLAHLAREAAGGSLDGVLAVGVGLPGLVDSAGSLRFAPNLAGGVELPVAGPLSAELGLAVAADNDATCAGWGEFHLGAGRPFDDCLMVTLGTGIGGGLVMGGRLQRGANGFAGEIGHMVVDPHGPPCPCGRRGCWERFASGSGLGRLGREAAHAGRASEVVRLAGGDPEAVRGEHVTAAALAGDDEARAVFAELAEWFALGLAGLVGILDPAAVVVGGGLVTAGDMLLEPVRAATSRMVVGSNHRPDVPIVAAELGDRAGAIGAALLDLAR